MTCLPGSPSTASNSGRPGEFNSSTGTDNYSTKTGKPQPRARTDREHVRRHNWAICVARPRCPCPACGAHSRRSARPGFELQGRIVDRQHRSRYAEKRISMRAGGTLISADPGVDRPLGCAGGRAQNIRFGPAQGSCLGNQVAEHVGAPARTTHARGRSRSVSPLPGSRGSDRAGSPPVHPGTRTGLLAVADRNRYADLTFGACRASAGCGREQTMTVMRTTGHDTTVKIQSLLSGAPAAPEIA
jgi:hypothetical protein